MNLDRSSLAPVLTTQRTKQFGMRNQHLPSLRGAALRRFNGAADEAIWYEKPASYVIARSRFAPFLTAQRTKQFGMRNQHLTSLRGAGLRRF
jgi:hypothetical protein